MRKLAALLVGLFAVCATQKAEAVPQLVSFTGRLTTSTGPVTGSVNLTFKLYDVATGGTASWTEVRTGVGASNGLVFVDLGQVTTLDSSLFTGTRMYLEVTVGTEVLSPRLAINSVPYAMHTENSDTLGGSITAADVVTSAMGTGGATATKTGNMLSVGLTTTGCTTGQAFKYNGTGFACANDADTLPVAGAGIAVAGSTVSLATTGCAANYVWKYNGTAWACAADANTTYTAGAGIGIAGTTVSLSTSGCAAGYVWKYNGMAFACSPDADTQYSAAVGGGLSLNAANAFSIASGGITSAMIGTDQVGMDELNVPIGASAFSVASTAGSSSVDVFPAAAVFTPTSSGNCMVTSYVETGEAAPTGYAYLYVARKDFTNNQFSAYGNNTYLSPFAPMYDSSQNLTPIRSSISQYSATSTYVVPVSAGVAYAFGCRVFFSSGTSAFSGNSYTCYSSYTCF